MNYNLYLRCNNEYIGGNVIAKSRKHAAILFAKRKQIELKDFLKIYTVMPSTIFKRFYFKNFCFNFDGNEYCYEYNKRSNTYICVDPNQSSVPNRLNVSNYLKFLAYLKHDGISIMI